MKMIFILLSTFIAEMAFALDMPTMMRGFSRSENAQPFIDIKSKYGYRSAYLLEVEVNKYWGMSRDGGGVAYYDLTQNGSVQGWPLIRWPVLRLIPEILADHREVGASQWKEQIEYTSRKPFAGCLNLHPLRHGDIEDDGASEIVLTLNGELIVFSPDYQRTVFSAFYDADDWYRDEMENVSLKSSLVKGESYQHLSEHLLYNGYSHKAHRVYTKLYINDYDQDGSSDVVTWQKVYASNKVDEAAGFHLVRNELRHFKRDLKAQEESDKGITGEYLPQETDEATIRKWLSENELTWKKGYPSASECEGEDGQLILEMHDPLLNDLEVLE